MGPCGWGHILSPYGGGVRGSYTRKAGFWMRRFKRAGLSQGVTHLMAWAALGITAGAAWGQVQAIIPADVSGPPAAAPAAQVPGAAAMPPQTTIEAEAPKNLAPSAVAQAVVPAEAGTVPSAVTLPAGTPSVSDTPAPTTPAVPTSPATAGSGGPLEP